ncbi:MAG: hypothetical protein J5506_09040 [Prevotella sp.]|nr:hypothetical protein [Prevotella sp.]
MSTFRHSISNFSSPTSSNRTLSPSRRWSATTPANSVSTAITVPREAPALRHTSFTILAVPTSFSCTATAFQRP